MQHSNIEKKPTGKTKHPEFNFDDDSKLTAYTKCAILLLHNIYDMKQLTFDRKNNRKTDIEKK